MRPRWELRSDFADRVDELALRYRITLGCRNSLLDEPMVLLDDVVQIRCRSAATTSTEFTGLLELGDRAGVGRMSVHVDDPRPRSAAFGRKPRTTWMRFLVSPSPLLPQRCYQTEWLAAELIVS